MSTNQPGSADQPRSPYGPLDSDPPPAPAAAPAKPSALPTVEREYHHFLRTPRATWWRGAVAIVALVVGFLLINLVLTGIGLGIDIASGRTSVDDLLADNIVVTPTVFLLNNLSLAALIPLSMLLQWALFGQRPRWLSSVQGGFRWRWFWRAAVVVVPVWAVYVAVLFVLDPTGFEAEVVPDGVFLLVVVLLTTPFQAAGEEYGARGLIARAAGSWFSRSGPALIVGGAIASALFTLAHLSTDPWLIAYYFVFGATMSIVAWRTGGLEVPVLIHAVNNLFVLIPAALFTDLSESFDRSAGVGGPAMLIPMAVLITMVFVVEWMARRAKIVRSCAPGAASAATRVG